MVRIEDVSVTFQGKGKETKAVRNVSLQINRGEIFGIVGTSGAGKSTLLRTINLLERPQSGKIFIKDLEISALRGEDLRKVRQGVGMIFQHFNLIHTKTVFENIAFPMRIAGKGSDEIVKRVSDLLKLVGLSDKIGSYPSKLSGGQKQRVGIARALANSPGILLCDEPTSALDLETTKSILDLLKKINRKLGITIIIISHEMDVIKNVCTRVAVMSSGELVELNPAYDIFAHPKHAVTMELVRHSLNLEIPKAILKGISGSVVKIVYHGEAAFDPVLSETIRKFSVNVNILHGKIEYIAGLPIGILIVNLQGAKNEINRSIRYFRERTADTEVIYG